MDNNHRQTKEQLKSSTVTTLAFLRGRDWFGNFKNLLSGGNERKAFFTGQLVSAGQGIGECMDERRCLVLKGDAADYFSSRNLEKPKPAMVGGAAGWTTYFLLTGQAIDQAIESTKNLYQQMNWGEMQVHIDDEHGHITDVSTLKNRLTGCGFLGVINEVAAITKNLLAGEGIVNQEALDIDSGTIMKGLIKTGAKVVPLTGNHKTKDHQARVVINDYKDKTLNRDALYEQNPAFLWDKWATTNNQVLEKFNQIAGQNLSQEQFIKLQTTVHLATGMMLEAITLGSDGNVILLGED
jgi:hypothetical protein